MRTPTQSDLNKEEHEFQILVDWEGLIRPICCPGPPSPIPCQAVEMIPFVGLSKDFSLKKKRDLNHEPIFYLQPVTESTQKYVVT